MSVPHSTVGELHLNRWSLCTRRRKRRCSQKRNQLGARLKEQRTAAGFVHLAGAVMESDVNMSWVISLRRRTSICFFSEGCRTGLTWWRSPLRSLIRIACLPTSRPRRFTLVRRNRPSVNVWRCFVCRLCIAQFKAWRVCAPSLLFVFCFGVL